jgi:hypothetical protein
MGQIDSRSDRQTSGHDDPRVEGWYVASAEATPAPYKDEDDPGKTLSLYRRILGRLQNTAAPAAH